jgi:hypothetical protein
MSAYPNGDDHPSSAGDLKGIGEFVPLLNIFYRRWKDAQIAQMYVFLPLMKR